VRRPRIIRPGRCAWSHEVESSFSSNGMETVAGTQAEFATFVRAELNKYAVLIRESGAADN